MRQVLPSEGVEEMTQHARPRVHGSVVAKHELHLPACTWSRQAENASSRALTQQMMHMHSAVGAGSLHCHDRQGAAARQHISILMVGPGSASCCLA